MKKSLIISLFLLFCTVLSAQNYSVSITSPASNSIVSGTFNDEHTNNVRIDLSWTGQKSDPQNIWRFHVKYDIPASVGGNIINPSSWTDENTPYVYFPILVNRSMRICVTMYEVTPGNVSDQRAYGYITDIASKQKVYVENNFGSGTVTVNNDSNVNSGTEFELDYRGTLNLAANANQTDASGYNMVWNSATNNPSLWTKTSAISGAVSTISTSSNCSYNACGENGVKITANFRKQCHFTSNGALLVDGSYKAPGTVVNVIEGIPISVNVPAEFVSSDYLVRQFTSWADNGSTTTPRSFTLSGHTTANMNSIVLRPDNGNRNQQYSTTAGQPITITWNEHPSTGVTSYGIYRTIKNVQSSTWLGSVSRGTTSFTDSSCLLTSTYSNNLISYDVRPYYAANNSSAEPYFIAMFGNYIGGDNPPNPEANRFADNNKSGLKVSGAIPTAYALGNYPNPFNPTTVIKYDLPEAGQVSLKVYNLLSQEVASLVEGSQSAGVHQVSFNAHNLPTGIYIARLQAGNKVMSVKLQLIK